LKLKFLLIFTIVFELLAILYTYNDYRAGKVTKKLFAIILTLGLLVEIGTGVALVMEI